MPYVTASLSGGPDGGSGLAAAALFSLANPIQAVSSDDWFETLSDLLTFQIHQSRASQGINKV